MPVEILIGFSGSRETRMERLLKFPRVRLLAFAAIALVCIACASPQPPYESLDWKVEQDFNLVYQKKIGWNGIPWQTTQALHYRKQGETADNWTMQALSEEWAVGEVWVRMFDLQPDGVMASLKATANKSKCATDDWTVLQQEATSILYEWKNIVCPNSFDQQEIVRIVMGRSRIWIIYYAIRNKLPADERTALIENLLTATVMEGVGD